MKYKIITITYVSGRTETLEVVGKVEYTYGVLAFQLREPMLTRSRMIEQFIKLDSVYSWTVEYVQ